MSNRTIVEFNHDFAYLIKDGDQDFVHALVRALKSSDKENWDILKRYGVRYTATAHHSDSRVVKINGIEYDL